MLQFTTFASGSSGNAALVSCGNTHILLDAGISARRITSALRQLEVEPRDLTATLLTHDHSDHIGGLDVFTKHNRIPIYATHPTCQTILKKSPHTQGLLKPQEVGFSVEIGGVQIQSFATPHDTVGSVGYSLTGDGVRMVLCTDLGHVTQEIVEIVRGCDLLVCEANHDEDWVRTGPYTHSLKERVLGENGHLSNRACAELALVAVQHGARRVVLAHLSSENNTPNHALQTVTEHLRRAGVNLEELLITIAPHDDMSNTCYMESQEVAKC